MFTLHKNENSFLIRFKIFFLMICIMGFTSSCTEEEAMESLMTQQQAAEDAGASQGEIPNDNSNDNARDNTPPPLSRLPGPNDPPPLTRPGNPNVVDNSDTTETNTGDTTETNTGDTTETNTGDTTETLTNNGNGNSNNNGNGNSNNNSSNSESTDPVISEETTDSSQTDEQTSEEDNNTANLIFEESFDYFLSDGTTPNSENFENDISFVSKWTTLYGSDFYLTQSGNSQGLTSQSLSNKEWGTSIISKQTFNLPLTIQWTQNILNYSSSKKSTKEGMCIYESVTKRDGKYNYPKDGNNLGCIHIKIKNNDFKLSNDEILDGFSDYTLNNNSHNYKITVNLNENYTYKVTIEYMDASLDDVVLEGVIEGNPSDFLIEFNISKYGDNGSTVYDNIKVWDDIMPASGI